MLLKVLVVMLGLGGSALASDDVPIDRWVSGEVRPPNIPDTWVGRAVDPGQAWRWFDPDNPGNSVTIHRGDPLSAEPSKREGYVVVRVDGRLIGRDGKPVDD